jgi:hypothetical protein
VLGGGSGGPGTAAGTVSVAICHSSYVT